MMRRFALAGLLGLLANVVMVACSQPEGNPTPDLSATSTLTPLVSSSSFEEVLRLIPDTPRARSSVYINDYAKVRELLDIQLPVPNADDDEIMEYFMRLRGAPSGDSCGIQEAPWINGMSLQDPPQFLANRQYLGFDLRNVDQSALVGFGPPRQVEVLVGRFDPEATEQALNACPECPPPLYQDYQGVPFYSWGEDMEMNPQMRLSPPAFDTFGRGGRIAVQDEHVFRAIWTEGIEELIDASLGHRASLADVEEFRLLAQGLSDVGACSGWISDDPEALALMLRLTFEEVPPLIALKAFAVGGGLDQTGRFTAMVLLHEDTVSAMESLATLRATGVVEEVGATGLEGRGSLLLLRIRR